LNIPYLSDSTNANEFNIYVTGSTVINMLYLWRIH